MSGQRLAAELCRAMRDGSTGAVEWRDEKRRRLFFFRSGVLVLIQSNLRSESPERLAERSPEMPPDALSSVVAATRLREALGEARGEVTLHPGVAAPDFEALDAIGLLWAAADRLPRLPADAWPRAVATSAPMLLRIPVGAEAVRYLLELDGTRPIDEVLEFGPEEPEVLANALSLAAALGAVEAGAGAGTTTQVVPAAAEPRHGEPRPGEPRPAEPRAGEPRPTEPRPPAPAAPPPASGPGGATRGTAPSSRAGGPRAGARSGGESTDDPVTVDDIAGFIRGALADEASGAPGAAGTAELAAAAPPSPAPAPAVAAEPTPATDGDLPSGPYGGASATVSLGGGRARVTSEAAVEPDEDPAVRFGPALARIRGARDHFAVLGTGWQDPAETHRRAYFALAQRLHPDRFVGAPPAITAVAEELFERVRAAWEVLGEDGRRQAYIAKVIRGEKTEEELAMEKVRLILEAEAEFKRGLTELNGGRLPGAHEHFVRAAAAMPDEIEFGAYAAYTTFRLAHGRDAAAADEALRRLESALQANERLDGVWVLYGVALRLAGRDVAARQALVTALKLKPSNPDAVREMKRLEREKEQPPPESGGGFFSKLFGKK